MKNTILYYYNLQPEVVLKQNDFFYFNINNVKYYFLPFKRSLEDVKLLYELDVELLMQNVPVHEMIVNKDKNIITIVNNVPYVLLKIRVDDKKKIVMSDINDLQVYTNIRMLNKNLFNFNWINLWCNKIDYFEYQINQIGKKYPILCDSLGYFIGMAETAISYVNYAINQNSKENLYFTISHRRIKQNDTFFDLYNPINLVIDSRVRDISEYIKYMVINDIDPWNDIKKYFLTTSYSYLEWQLLYGRLIFPTYYFDKYEAIISGDIAEEDIVPLISKTKDYEQFLQDFYIFSKQYVNIQAVDWLIKRG